MALIQLKVADVVEQAYDLEGRCDFVAKLSGYSSEDTYFVIFSYSPYGVQHEAAAVFEKAFKDWVIYDKYSANTQHPGEKKRIRMFVFEKPENVQ